MSNATRGWLLVVVAWTALAPCAPGAEAERTWRRQTVIRIGKFSAEIMAFAADGKLLAVGAADGAVTLWDTRTGKFRGRVRRPGRRVFALGFARDGKALVAVGEDGNVVVWDVAAGRQQKVFRIGRADLAAAALSPDGKVLAVVARPSRAGRACPVQLLDADRALPIRSLAGHRYPAFAVQFSGDGKQLMTVGPRDRTPADPPSIDSYLNRTVPEVKVWDVAGGRGTTLPVSGHVFRFSANGATVVVCIQDPRTHKFHFEMRDVKTKKKRSSSGPLPEIVLCADLSPDGTILATAGYGRAVRLWDPKTGKQRAALPGPQEPVVKVLFSREGNALAATSSDGAVYVWSSVSSSKG
jgi:WD40 repeat protein